MPEQPTGAQDDELRREVRELVHDLRGTLSNIASFAQLLPRTLEGVELSEQATTMLDRLTVNALKAADQLETLRDAARTDEER